MLDLRPRLQIVEGPSVAQPDEVGAPPPLDEGVVGETRHRHPLAVLAPAVLGLRVDGGGDVRRQRPRRRRPDDDRLAGAVEQGEAHAERRVGAILVDAGLGQLVLRERRPAAGAPLGGSVPHIEPAALVDDLQELPDVLDVRVAEGEVVVAPVHPLAEALTTARQVVGGADDDLAAAAGGHPPAAPLPLPPPRAAGGAPRTPPPPQTPAPADVLAHPREAPPRPVA